MDEILRHSGREIKLLVDQTLPSVTVLRSVSHSLFVDGASLVKIGYFLTFVKLMIEKHPRYKLSLCEESLKILCEVLKFD